MASEVDICNLALGHLGDAATVSSIDPPEGSAQAEHCARFHPIARDSLLEMHDWNFATTRVVLAELTSAWSEWKYCYACPTDAINLLAVMSNEAADDYNINSSSQLIQSGLMTTSASYAPQPFSQETLPDGTLVIYTNQENAMLRYSRSVTDTTIFSALFVDALAWYLASFLAGPVIKGDQGAAEAKRCMQMAMGMLSKAATSDANQRRTQIVPNVGWIAGR